MVRLYLLIILTTLFTVSLFAQQGTYARQDSLQNITVEGTIIIDTTYNRDMYLLDINGDDVADYILNFGPYWYQPDSSLAVRPQDGDIVTILGGLCAGSNCTGDLQVIIVYEVNGSYWRDPFEPYWNNFLTQSKGKAGHHGYANGWLTDSLAFTEASGTVMIDTTFTFWHYYLDADGDSIPEYYLNFGPPWYMPEEGVQKPSDGETITVYGAVKDGLRYLVVIVFEINGEVWRDAIGFDGKELGGRWIHKNMDQYRYIHTAFDTLSGMKIQAGWKGTHSQQMPDSLYCQMLQLFPENIPYLQNQNAFAAFETGVFNRNRVNMMVRNDSVGESLQLANQVQFRFHYNAIQAQGYKIDESTIRLKVWDANMQNWQIVDDAVLNVENNTVSYSSATINSLIILTANESVTALGSDSNQGPEEFALKQNYPNPFNPTTLISYQLPINSSVKLVVYDVLGRVVNILVNEKQPAGTYNITFNAENLANGIYFYKLQAGIYSEVKRMLLIK